MLVAPCGSTPTGGCDDLPALATVARRYRAWFHVDAAHGGGFLFSRRMRGKLRGADGHNHFRTVRGVGYAFSPRPA